MKRKAKRIVQQPPKLSQLTRKTGPHFSDGLGTSVPPEFLLVQIYFDQQGLAECAEAFFREKEMSGWKTRFGKPIRNWKECANEWIYDRRLMLRQEMKRSPFYCENL